MAILPITNAAITPHGKFGYLRQSSADGGCGVSGYPCVHPGVDLAGKAGTAVLAPEAGVVVKAQGDVAPFRGYGPWSIVIKGESGAYHLLAHLSTTTANLAKVGQTVAAGAKVGTVASNHTHWEVRKKVTPAGGEGNMANNRDPMFWLNPAKTIGLMLGLAGGLYYLLIHRKKEQHHG